MQDWPADWNNIMSKSMQVAFIILSRLKPSWITDASLQTWKWCWIDVGPMSFLDEIKGCNTCKLSRVLKDSSTFFGLPMSCASSDCPNCNYRWTENMFSISPCTGRSHQIQSTVFGRIILSLAFWVDSKGRFILARCRRLNGYLKFGNVLSVTFMTPATSWYLETFHSKDISFG